MTRLRIWHNSKFGDESFRKEVKDLEEAKLLLKTLADYDLYLEDLIPCNAQGLEEYVGEQIDWDTNEGWTEWNDEEGRDIDEVMRDEE